MNIFLIKFDLDIKKFILSNFQKKSIFDIFKIFFFFLQLTDKIFRYTEVNKKLEPQRFFSENLPYRVKVNIKI